MTPEKVWAALERYDRELAAQGWGARQFKDEEYASKDLSRPALFEHCRWMAQRCLTVFKLDYAAAVVRARRGGFGITTACDHMEAAFEPLGKAMRWLAYIQGVLNALGSFSCNELRDHSRGEGKDVPEPTLTFHGTKCRVVLERYEEGGRVAVQLVDAETGEPFSTATTNLPGEPLAADEVFIKNYSENEGMLDALEAAGIVKRTGREVRSGYVVIYAAKLLLPPPPPVPGGPFGGMSDDDWAEMERHPVSSPKRKPKLPIKPMAEAVRDGSTAMVDAAASILGLSAKQTEEITDQLTLKKALDTPDDRRTPAQVERLKRSVYGCCNRHADNQGCDCLSQAEANEKAGRTK